MKTTLLVSVARLECCSRSNGSSKKHIISETTFPPFGFLMTFDSPPPDDRLTDLTYFADRYGDERTLWLRFPILPIYTYFPADYRDWERVLRDAGQCPREE